MKKAAATTPASHAKARLTHALLSRWTVWIILLLASLAKLWLAAGQHLDIISVSLSPYDQGTFFTLAQNILHGHWLGPYNDLTLAKGPFYPLYIAGTSLLHIPLLLSEQLLYVMACFVFLLSIRPLLRSHEIGRGRAWATRHQWDIITVILGITLLFNPMMTDINSGAQVMREGIYPALTLLTLSLFIGLVSWRRARPWKYALVSVAAGLALSAFWLTREEGSWIEPFLAGITIYLAVLTVRHCQAWPDWKWKLGLIVLPFFILWAALFGVVAINDHYYGVPAVVEFKTPQFLAAYSSLTRVQDGTWRQFVPVSIKQRQLIYQVSPAFAQLKPYLEGGLGQGWAQAADMPPPDQGQINGGAFMWAFRRAVADAGYYKNGKTALNYYTTLARQVNTACAQGKLTCVKSTNSMYPPLNHRYLRPFLANLYHAPFFFVGFRKYDPLPVDVVGDSASVDAISAVTRQPATNLYGHKRVAVLEAIGSVYQLLFPVIMLISLVAYAAALFVKRSYKDRLFIVTSLVGITLLARIVLLSVITATSFPAVNTLYFSCAYPLLILFDGLCLLLVYPWQRPPRA